MSTTHESLSYLDPARPEPWASFLEQIDRVAPHLGKLVGVHLNWTHPFHPNLTHGLCA